MTGLLNALTQIAFLRKDPSGLPSSPASVVVFTAAYLAADLLIGVAGHFRAVLPRSGHAINLEEPALFNRLAEDFFHQVEAGRWGPRDARSTLPSIYGPGGKP